MTAHILKPDTPQATRQAVQEAADCINNGGLVIFPTETVYGIAARADIPAALERLAELKERPVDKPFTLHIPDQCHIDRYLPTISLLERHFFRRALPGPITIVSELTEQQMVAQQERLGPELISALYSGNSIGLRLPDHSLAREFLRLCQGPVVAPSANRAGQSPPQGVEAAVEAVGDVVPLALDGGPTIYRQSSTVIRLTPDPSSGRPAAQILRPGVLDQRAIDRWLTMTIVMVCTGNTCRSPMAEGLLRDRLAGRLGVPCEQLPELGYHVSSAGVMAFNGAPASLEAVEACGEKGISIASHRSTPLSNDLIDQADYLFTMSASHRASIIRMAPHAESKTFLLDEHADISDPIGQPLEAYRRCRDRIDQAIEARLEQLDAFQPLPPGH